MVSKEWLMLPLFEQFIKDTKKGKRLKVDGSRIKPQTIINYDYALEYLKEYEQKTLTKVRIKEIKGSNQRLFNSEKKYWRKFYEGFTAFLFKEKGFYDNYVGSIIKTIRVFFNWLKKDKGIMPGDFYKNFYVRKEEIPIVTLMPSQLNFLINDIQFHESLSPSLNKSRAIFVFGCTVALRISDLFKLKFNDILIVEGKHYLQIKTIKTGTLVRIKLPEYAIEILNFFSKSAKRRKTIFPPIPPSRFNLHIKEIGKLAGWTEVIGKSRTKRGIIIEHKRETNQSKFENYRFCDLISSHTMRRTAITTMLMLGMKEHIVKKLSGHAGNSKSFYRYVNLVQTYLDTESDAVWNQFEKVQREIA